MGKTPEEELEARHRAWLEEQEHELRESLTSQLDPRARTLLRRLSATGLPWRYRGGGALGPLVGAAPEGGTSWPHPLGEQ